MFPVHHSCWADSYNYLRIKANHPEIHGTQRNMPTKLFSSSTIVRPECRINKSKEMVALHRQGTQQRLHLALFPLVCWFYHTGALGAILFQVAAPCVLLMILTVCPRLWFTVLRFQLLSLYFVSLWRSVWFTVLRFQLLSLYFVSLWTSLPFVMNRHFLRSLQMVFS